MTLGQFREETAHLPDDTLVVSLDDDPCNKRNVYMLNVDIDVDHEIFFVKMRYYKVKKECYTTLPMILERYVCKETLDIWSADKRHYEIIEVTSLTVVLI